MIMTINVHDFRNAFREMGRSDNFSHEGLALIFEYIEEYESETGEPQELDVVAICCEWAESTPRDIIEAYSLDAKIPQFTEHGANSYTDAELLQLVHEYLWDETQVAGVTNENTIVYVQF